MENNPFFYFVKNELLSTTWRIRNLLTLQKFQAKIVGLLSQLLVPNSSEIASSFSAISS